MTQPRLAPAKVRQSCKTGMTQVVAAILAVVRVYVIASGKPDWAAGGFASNGYGDLSPAHSFMVACFLAELVLTSSS